MKSKRTFPSTMSKARALRKNLTPEEQKLWAFLRNHQVLGIGFRRQHAIGPYVVDFCAPSEKLIIEVDGSQHLDLSDYEIDRSQFLSASGYHVLRFWNSDITNDVQSVIIKITQTIQDSIWKTPVKFSIKHD